MNKKEVIERAVKTFIEAFFCVFIPELVAILNGGFPDISVAWKVFAPVISAALATAISATWNTVEGYLKAKK